MKQLIVDSLKSEVFPIMHCVMNSALEIAPTPTSCHHNQPCAHDVRMRP